MNNNLDLTQDKLINQETIAQFRVQHLEQDKWLSEQLGTAIGDPATFELRDALLATLHLEEYNNQFHFYGSNVHEWKTSSDLFKVIKHFSSSEFPYQLWRVPLAEESNYAIQDYCPKVLGANFLGVYQTRKLKK
jgi:hypothetical protein